MTQANGLGYNVPSAVKTKACPLYDYLILLQKSKVKHKHTIFFSKLLGFFICNVPLGIQITLVADQKYHLQTTGNGFMTKDATIQRGAVGWDGGVGGQKQRTWNCL